MLRVIWPFDVLSSSRASINKPLFIGSHLVWETSKFKLYVEVFVTLPIGEILWTDNPYNIKKNVYLDPGDVNL